MKKTIVCLTALFAAGSLYAQVKSFSPQVCDVSGPASYHQDAYQHPGIGVSAETGETQDPNNQPIVGQQPEGSFYF